MGLLGHLWWWFEVHTGTVNESGPYYGFWSGFGSDIGEVTLAGVIVTPVIVAYRHHICHHEPCRHLAHHTTPDGYRLCKRCVGRPKSELILHDIHEDHR